MVCSAQLFEAAEQFLFAQQNLLPLAGLFQELLLLVADNSEYRFIATFNRFSCQFELFWRVNFLCGRLAELSAAASDRQ